MELHNLPQNDSFLESGESSNDSSQIIEHDELETNYVEEINLELKNKAKRLQSEKFRISQEAQNWAQAAHYWKGEADKLQAYAAQSSDAALSQMDQNVSNLLEQAKENKRRALEEGDTELAVQADIDMSRAMARIETIDNHYLQREAERQQYLNAIEEAKMQEQYAYATPQIAPEIDVPVEAEYLVRNNPWMDPSHPTYDPNRVGALYQYTRELDENLARQGRHHEYFTPAYVNEVNSFIRNNLTEVRSNHDRRTEPSRSSYNNVSPVSRGSNGYGSSRPKERYVLTEDEKFMAQNAGLSEEVWLKHKIEDIKNQKNNPRNNYGQ